MRDGRHKEVVQMKITPDLLESVVKSFRSNIELTQEIFCECPYCGRVFPLSEGRLMTREKARIDIIKRYQERIEKLEEKEEELEEKKEELEEMKKELEEKKEKIEKEKKEELKRLREEFREAQKELREEEKERLEKLREKLERKLEEKYRKREIELEKNIDKEAMKRLKELQKQEKEAREDAIKRSRAVTMGHVLEIIAPILMSSKYNPKDFRPILNPIDYVVFNGLSEKGYVSEIVFIEVKYGDSSYNPRETSVKQVVEEGKVRFEEFRRNEDDLLQIAKAVSNVINLQSS